jgi:hypothetical protein
MPRRSTTPKIRDVKYTLPKNPDGVWKEGRDGSREIQFGTLRVTVGEDVSYPHGVLVVRCLQVFGDRPVLLQSKDIERAKAEAIDDVNDVISKWATDLSQFQRAKRVQRAKT